MTKFLRGGSRPLLALTLALAGTLAGMGVPALAQDSNPDARLRRLEAEVRDLKKQAGVAGTVAPQAIPTTTSTVSGTPASTPVSDLLARMESIESQLARLTAQNEEGGNKLRLLEERVAANEAAAKAAAAAAPAAVTTTVDPSAGTVGTVSETASSSNLTAMTGPAPRPARAPAANTAATATAAATGAATGPRTAPTKPVAPSAQRVAGVRAVVKPDTGDAAEDEYTYGFRLWEAKFYPEAQQQLKLFIDKYPRSPRLSYARNLMGRSLLEEGKPRDAASWFLQNYQANKQGERAPDSLLFLGESMSRMKDSSRACIALAEFAETYPREAAGRLKSQYDATRGSVKCN